MPALYILIGAVLGIFGFGTAYCVSLNRKLRKDFDKRINEERDSFIRCQAYLDRSDAE